jgi:UDP-N-acetylmuramate dehydrogenase
LKIQEQISLKPFNTFGIDAKAHYFTKVETVSELREALLHPKFIKKFILGGGSNMLLTTDIEALVILLALKGKEITEDNDNYVHVKVSAGENWHNFVQWTLANNYGGLENLSLIPGNVGAAPIQNIGAYGVELKDTFVGCEAMDIATGEIHRFSNKACRFAYRDSIFKNSHKGRYVIITVTFRLSTKDHKINTSYGAIEKELAAQYITNPTIQQVASAVISIRQSKLPDPAEVGNSGSFFKNPVISYEAFEKLQKEYPDMPFYKVSETKVKVPAGWLIEQCGFKGKRFGDAGVHDKQALVLVNHGDATGQEILSLARRIQKKVQEIFNIEIETEVNII